MSPLRHFEGLQTSRVWFLTLAALVAAPQALAAEGTAVELPRMLTIKWTRGPDLPQGFQDSDGGFVGDTLVTACGFCSGLERDNAVKPGKYPRGFLQRVWGFDAATPDATWRSLPHFPGAARQGAFAAVVNDSLCIWGGFSYDAPYCYADGWRLSRSGDDWTWTQLPNLPWKLTSAGVTTIGSKVYVFGGADYDGVVGFHTMADREGQIARLGARLHVWDATRPDAPWKELPQCPGTPRFVHAVQSVGERIYVLGGATGGSPTCTVVDNWSFDTQANAWTRLRDLPVSSGNFPKSSNLLFANRYIVLPGGHQYDCVANPDGTTREKFGVASRRNPDSGLHNDVFVYDVETGRFGSATPLPIDNNLPMTVVRGNQIYLLGGGTGGGRVDGVYYGHHPELTLIGKLASP